MRNTTILLATLVSLTVAAVATGCDSDRRPASWKDVQMANQPTLFERRHGHPALADLDGLYLGQSKKAALDALHDYCEHPVRRDSGMFGGEASFLGCRFEEGTDLTFLRVGFWPKIDDRVATLEVKRANVPPAAVRRAYLDLLEEKPDETLKHRRIQIASKSYRMYAGWDDGRDGPVHLVVGFAPDFELDE